MRNYDERRWNRYIKGIRRVREDRMEHGGSKFGLACPCFGDEVTHGRGAIFDRFADTPQVCSTCCGNRRQWEGPSRQERRAPTVKDWD